MLWAGTSFLLRSTGGRFSKISPLPWRRRRAPAIQGAAPKGRLAGDYRGLMGFNGDYRGLMGFNGDYRGLMGFNGDYRGLMGFNGDYRGLMGFNGDYRGLINKKQGC